MPFPSSVRVQYARNPLKEVICQLRFPAVLAISANPPSDFQEAIRQEYPLYEPSVPLEQLPEDVNRVIASIGISFPLGGRTHAFTTLDHRRMVTLSQDAIALTDRTYVDWPSFRANLRFVADWVRRIYRPVLFTRIGLRYQNFIDREELHIEDVPWAALIQPSFAGLIATEEIGAEIHSIDARTITRLAIEPESFVLIRHGLFDAAGTGHRGFVIDSDFYTQAQVRSDGEDAFSILDEFHRISGDLFRWAIKPRLTAALGDGH